MYDKLVWEIDGMETTTPSTRKLMDKWQRNTNKENVETFFEDINKKI